MTKREFFDAVVHNRVDPDVIAFAAEEIEKMDLRNERRRNANNPKKQENAEKLTAILEFLKTADSALPASEIAKALDMTTAKVASLLAQVKDGSVIKTPMPRVNGKGRVTGYKIHE